MVRDYNLVLIDHKTGYRLMLRLQSLDFREKGEVLNVECVDSLNAIDLHSGDNLEIEDVGPCNGTAAEQTLQFLGRVLGCGKNWQEGPQP